MSIDTITPTDELVLGLVRNAGVGNYAVVTDLHPRTDAAQLADIRHEVEDHAPGYLLQQDYGIWAGTRGVRLSTRPDEVTVQDRFYDGFEKGHVLRVG